jgi:beta-glucanase (GH16 family)
MNVKQALYPAVMASALFSPSLFATSFSDSLHTMNHAHWWLADGWENGFPFLNRWEAEAVSFGPEGMTITLAADEQGMNSDESLTFYSGELRSYDFYGYGCFEIDMKPVQAPGVVTSFFLFAGPHDKPHDGSGIHNEIDVEFLGSDTRIVQLNFWTDDDTYLRSHETIIPLGFDASEAFHRYGISWNRKYIEWFVDGKSVYKVRNRKNDPIPTVNSSRLRIMANLWATDPDIADWAGLFDQQSTVPLQATYRNFSFTANQRCKEQL